MKGCDSCGLASRRNTSTDLGSKSFRELLKNGVYYDNLFLLLSPGNIIIIIIIIILGLVCLTCSGIDALPSFPRAPMISSSSRFVVEGVFRQSGVVHSFRTVDPVLFVFGSHVLYYRDL